MKSSNKVLFFGLITILVLMVLLTFVTRIPKAHKPDIGFIKHNMMMPVIHSSSIISTNGNATSINLNFPKDGFDKIVTNGAWDIDIVEGDAFKVSINVDQNIAKYIISEKQGDTFYLGIKPHHSYAFESGQVKAEITLPKLSKVDTSGASNIHFAGFSGDNLTIQTSGDSKVVGENNLIKNLNIVTSGESQIIVSKTNINDLDINASGDSQFNFEESITANANLGLSGSSEVQLKMNGGKLTGNLSGNSTVIYKGKVSSQKIKTSGAASVRKEN
jgi:hypothetical protein